MSPFDLEKEFGAGIMMKILARVGAADGHDDELAVLKQQLVADRRLEQAAILIDPRAQVERRRIYAFAALYRGPETSRPSPWSKIRMRRVY